jgi:hypothetical protein
MLKNITIMEIEKNGRTYQLHLSNESPLGECFDVLYEMQNFVVSRINEAQRAMDNKPEHEQKTEE